MGFYQLIVGLTDRLVDKIVKFIPNSWFIQGFTDIIVYHSAKDHVNMSYEKLIWSAIFLMMAMMILNHGSVVLEYLKNRNGRS